MKLDSNGNIQTTKDGNPMCFHNFFTYDPTPSGVDTFEIPFVQSSKGVLCNWFGGCESISETLSILLDGGFFYGFPWTPAIGYAFRKPEIPKLVFVFTNEFDNEICRQDETEAWTHSLVAVPGFADKIVSFNPAMVGYTGLFSNTWQQNLSAFDPYCISWLNPDKKGELGFINDWKSYVEKVAGLDVGNYMELIEGMFSLGIGGTAKMTIGNSVQSSETDGVKPPLMKYSTISISYIPLCRHTTDLGTSTKATALNKVYTYLSKTGLSWDLRRRSETEVIPSTNQESALRKILTDQQVDDMKNGRITGVTGTSLDRTISYDQTNTLGFYHLRNVLSKWQSPLAGYVFTSDGSFQNQDADANSTDVPYLYSDNALFQYINQNFSIPQDLFDCASNIWADAPVNGNVGMYDDHWTWKSLLLSNMMYWVQEFSQDIDYEAVFRPDTPSGMCDKLATILGRGDPKKRTTIVWAFRNGQPGEKFLDTNVAVKDDPKKQSRRVRRLVIGLPLTWNNRSDASVERELKNWWNNHRDDGNGGYRDMLAYAKQTGRLVRYATDWRDNVDNCRMSLT